MESAYLAGFFDGEGCVGVKRGSTLPSVRLQLAQKEPSVLHEIREIYGGSLSPAKGAWILTYQRPDEVRRFIEAILPHSRIKREKLALALQLLAIQEKDAAVMAIQGRSAGSSQRTERLAFAAGLKNV